MSSPVVVLTRAAADNLLLRGALEAKGAIVIERPMIEVAPPADGGAALRASVDRLADYDWLVLTSANGVRAVVDANRDRPWPTGLRVAAVGSVTAAAGSKAGLPVDLVPDRATAADLVAAFPAGACRVLAAVAELASEVVEEGLAAKGHRVDRVTAYRTVEPAPSVGVADAVAHERAEPAEAVEPGDAIAFFSPSAVTRYVDRFATVPPVVVCIGPVTATRARDAGLQGVLTAEPHDTDGVLLALASALALGP